MGDNPPKLNFKGLYLTMMIFRTITITGMVCIFLTLTACGGEKTGSNAAATNNSPNGSSQSSGVDAAKTLLGKFLVSGADHAALSKKLRPTKADYESVFTTEVAAKVQASYDPAWDEGKMVIKPNAGQTELLIWSATSAQLKTWTGPASEQFPGGYKDAAKHLKDKLTVYRFKFVKSGGTLGMAYDGLIHVNGQWRIFPKPYRALR